MDNFSCTEKGEKGFNLKEIKKLIEQEEKDDDYNLIMRFYMELLLVSEIIDDKYENKDIRRKMGFYFNNQDEIPFDKLTFFNIHDKNITYITGEENYFYKQKDIENDLYYSNQYNKWYFDISTVKYDEYLNIDELYFEGIHKNAKNIQVLKNSYKNLNNETFDFIKSFSEFKKAKELFNKDETNIKNKNRLKKAENQLEKFENKFKKAKPNIKEYLQPKQYSQPIGIKYSYQEVDNKEVTFFLDKQNNLRSIGQLSDDFKKEFDLKQDRNSKTPLVKDKNKQLISELFLLANGYKEISLERKEISYKGKYINKHFDAKKFFYKKNINLKDINEKEKDISLNIIFCSKKKLYSFRDTIIFESTDSKSERKIKAIALKKKDTKTQGCEYIFQSNHADILNKKDYMSSTYKIKLMEHEPALNKEYIILHKEEIEETKSYARSYTKDDIYKKYYFNIENIFISIFDKKTTLNDILCKENHISMIETNDIKCNYLKVLYRFRNSIAHGEFKILDDRIIFCNTQDNGSVKKTVLKAQILKKDIDFFLKELMHKTLDMQL